MSSRSSTGTVGMHADIDLGALRRRYCRHAAAVDVDPLALSWPRGLACLTCGELVDHDGRERGDDGGHRLQHEPTAPLAASPSEARRSGRRAGRRE